jgi:flagellar basal body L-ring protein FlgH
MRIALLACLALTGCAAHVDLVAPPASAPLQSRVAAYDRLKGLSYHSTTITTYGPYGGSTSHATDYMQLASGDRVYYPEDILPVVPDDSPAAKAADASRSKRDTTRTLTWLAVASVAAGAVLAITPIATAHDGNVDGTPVFAGLGLAILGGAGFAIAAHFVGESAEDEAATAYETYDAALLQRLNLCPNGSSLGDCR